VGPRPYSFLGSLAEFGSRGVQGCLPSWGMMERFCFYLHEGVAMGRGSEIRCWNWKLGEGWVGRHHVRGEIFGYPDGQYFHREVSVGSHLKCWGVVFVCRLICSSADLWVLEVQV
jgi:hypothetical protein